MTLIYGKISIFYVKMRVFTETFHARIFPYLRKNIRIKEKKFITLVPDVKNISWFSHHEGSLLLENDPSNLSRAKGRIVVELKGTVNDLSVGADAAGLNPCVNVVNIWNFIWRSFLPFFCICILVPVNTCIWCYIESTLLTYEIPCYEYFLIRSVNSLEHWILGSSR